jgi:site-specific DNA recombinase
MTRTKLVERDPAAVRCAVYTRKSTEEGLEQEFNSLDAQREAAEAYIASQRHEGWRCLEARYDDGGFSGGTADRPALKRLLADVEAGRVDCVVVYKVDRLSRSLLDFTKLMEVFDRRKVSFVSVTQQFNTASSMGRLVLNVLLSFAQFEREIIGERTRDKISAMRRKGKWAGGLPPLGYDADPVTSKLVVNADEAARVRAIFALYRQHGSLLPVVEELRERGWANKRCTTKKGTERGGRAFDRTSLHRLLTNVAYAGRVPHKGESFPGEHPALVDQKAFEEVQAQLRRNGRTGGAGVRNKSGALLKGLLRCGHCACAMTPSFTSKGSKRYRYYVCSAAQKNGRATCPARSVPAGPIDEFVVERIRGIGRDPVLVRETVAAVRAQHDAEAGSLAAERRLLDREQRKAEAEVRALSGKLAGDATGLTLQRLAEVQAEVGRRQARLDEVRSAEADLSGRRLDEASIAAALAEFDGVWESLTPREQARLVSLLVEGVDYDGGDSTVSIRFHPSGIRSLAGGPELAEAA